MKKLFLVLAVFSISFFACNRNNSNSKAGKDVEPYRQGDVQNVNGNIPDTTNTIDVSRKKVDTAKNKSDTSLHQ